MAFLPITSTPSVSHPIQTGGLCLPAIAMTQRSFLHFLLAPPTATADSVARSSPVFLSRLGGVDFSRLTNHIGRRRRGQAAEPSICVRLSGPEPREGFGVGSFEAPQSAVRRSQEDLIKLWTLTERTPPSDGFRPRKRGHRSSGDDDVENNCKSAGSIRL